jgi:hypothetical protein
MSKKIFSTVPCPFDGCKVTLETTEEEARTNNEFKTSCPRCGAIITFTFSDIEKTISVHGTDATEVKSVSEALVDKLEKQEQAYLRRNPWVSGSFYLTSTIIIITLLLLAVRQVNIFYLPIVVISCVLIISLVGAFQLRQDSRVTEKNFLTLMLMIFKLIPLLRNKNQKNTVDEN